MKKIVLTLVLMLLFSLVAGLQAVHFGFANFFPEPAPLGIRIESDGSVNGTDKIQCDGNTYTFTGNIEGTIVVLRNDIVIDGAGCTLQGNGDSVGIFLQGRNNVTVKGMVITNFQYGVKLTWEYSESGSSNNMISGNIITDNSIGIQLTLFTKNNFVYDNVITNNSYGVMISHSPNNVFRNNQLKDNQFNMWVYVETCVPASYYVNDIDTSNTVNDKPIYYWVNQHEKTVPSDAGYVALISCSKITVQNLILSNNGQGVLLVGTINSLITKNQLKNNGYGIVVYGPYEACADNTITKNEITGWTEKDIFVWSDLQNNIYDNEAKTLVVPDDYPTISSAVENASAGDTIFVRKGTYQEQSLEINKSISLIAEDSHQTILNLNPPLVKTGYLRNWIWIPDSAININANDVTLQGFTINLPDDGYGVGSGIYIISDRIALIDNTIANRSVYLRGNMQNITGNLLPSTLEVIGSHQIIANNTIGDNLKIQGSFNQVFANNINSTYYFSGVHLNGSNNVIVNNSFSTMTMEGSDSNIIGDNVFARLVLESGCSHNLITKNRVAGNGGINDGIQVLSGSNNTVDTNSIRNCEYGLRVGSEATQTSVYLNNFYNNTEQHVACFNLTENRFDNGLKGNYYDTYNGNDGNWDGIGDSPYTIQEIHWDEELQREVTVVYFQDNLPLMAPFDIDGASIQLPDWASGLSHSLPETQTLEPFPIALVTVVALALVSIVSVGLIVYSMKFKKATEKDGKATAK